MSASPFIGLVRFALAADDSGLRDVQALVRDRVGALRTRDAGDLEQDILVILAGAPAKSLLILRRLARRNPGLETFLDAAPLAAPAPSVPPELVVAVDKQLFRYVTVMAENALKSRWRKLRREAALPGDDVLADPVSARDDHDETLSVAQIVLERILASEDLPSWFGGALQDVQRLAEGTLEMASLVQTCIAGDPQLLALDPSTAKKRATDRLQKHHERVRTRLLLTSRLLVDEGRLTPDEGGMAERWVALLKRRRQKDRPRASGGQS